MHSEIVKRACLQVTRGLCSACLFPNVTSTIKLTGYEKKKRTRLELMQLNCMQISLQIESIFYSYVEN